MYDQTIVSGTTSDNTYVPLTEGTKYWRVAAVNNNQTAWSGWRSFSVKVIPNCSNLTGPTEIPIGVNSSFTADFYSPMGNLGAQIFHNNMVGMAMQAVSTNPQNVTGTWIPNAATDGVGNTTVSCRAWNDGIAECRPPAFVDGWPRAACVGPTYTFPTCVEGFTSGNPTYVHPWLAWGACSGAHVRSRTRTCSEDCMGLLKDDCNVYMTTDPSACPVGSTCSYNAGTRTQTETQDCIATIQGTLFDASDCYSSVGISCKE